MIVQDLQALRDRHPGRKTPVHAKLVRAAGVILTGGRIRDAKQHGIALLTEDRKRDGLLLGFPVRENITLGKMRAISRIAILLDKRQETRRATDCVPKLDIRTPGVKNLSPISAAATSKRLS